MLHAKESLDKIEILEAEINNLKDTIKIKEEELQAKSSEELIKEKKMCVLTEKIDNLISENKTLKANNEVLLEQISLKHSELEKIKSDFVGNKCNSEAETNQSVEMERNFKCKDCDFTFDREFDLIIHNSTKHTIRKQDQCEFKVSRKTDLELQKRFDHGKNSTKVTKNLPTS